MSYFATILSIHPKAQIVGRVSEQVSEQVSEHEIKILEFCTTPRKKQEILRHIGLASVYMNYKRHIVPLVEKRFLELTIPDKPKSRLQKYQITEAGKALLRKQKKK